jgi:uncharacterized membrane protein
MNNQLLHLAAVAAVMIVTLVALLWRFAQTGEYREVRRGHAMVDALVAWRLLRARRLEARAARAWRDYHALAAGAEAWVTAKQRGDA